jgi:hypothetical protein
MDFEIDIKAIEIKYLVDYPKLIVTYCQKYSCFLLTFTNGVRDSISIRCLADNTAIRYTVIGT